MSGETPDGSPLGSLPVTNRKFPMLIAARSTPVGASSETIWGEAWTGIGGFRLVRAPHPRRIIGDPSACEFSAGARRLNMSRRTHRRPGGSDAGYRGE